MVLAGLGRSGWGAEYPGPANGYEGRFDVPIALGGNVVPTPRGLEDAAPWRLTCYDYPGYRVKTLVGSGKGDLIVSVTPARPSSPTIPCSSRDDPGEKVISRTTFWFAAARGGFLFLLPTDGYSFAIYDAPTGRKLYNDAMLQDAFPPWTVSDDALIMNYRRVVPGPCSLLSPECWARFVHNAHVPIEISREPAPIAACEATFRNQPAPAQGRQDFTILTYQVTVRLSRTGASSVLSRSGMNCLPTE